MFGGFSLTFVLIAPRNPHLLQQLLQPHAAAQQKELGGDVSELAMLQRHTAGLVARAVLQGQGAQKPGNSPTLPVIVWRNFRHCL